MRKEKQRKKHLKLTVADFSTYIKGIDELRYELENGTCHSWTESHRSQGEHRFDFTLILDHCRRHNEESGGALAVPQID